MSIVVHTTAQGCQSFLTNQIRNYLLREKVQLAVGDFGLRNKFLIILSTHSRERERESVCVWRRNRKFKPASGFKSGFGHFLHKGENSRKRRRLSPLPPQWVQKNWRKEIDRDRDTAETEEKGIKCEFYPFGWSRVAPTWLIKLPQSTRLKFAGKE